MRGLEAVSLPPNTPGSMTPTYELQLPSGQYCNSSRTRRLALNRLVAAVCVCVCCIPVNLQVVCRVRDSTQDVCIKLINCSLILWLLGSSIVGPFLGISPLCPLSCYFLLLFFCLLPLFASPLVFPCAKYFVWDTQSVHEISVPYSLC